MHPAVTKIRTFVLASVVAIISAPSHALTEDLMRSSVFGPVSDEATIWETNALTTVLPITGGYLAIGDLEVEDTNPGEWIDGTAVHAYKLDANLAPVTSYGTDGKLQLPLPPGYLVHYPSATRLASGKIMVIAEGWPEGEYSLMKFVLMRLNADGSADTTFGTDGWRLLEVPYSASPAESPLYTANAGRIFELSNGQLIVTGSSARVGYSRLGIVGRLSAEGVVDTTFGPNGNGFLLVQPVGAGYGAWLEHAALDSAGRLVVSGSTAIDEGGAYYDLFVARITLAGAGALDSSFNGSGIKVFSIGAEDSWSTGLRVDGNTILVGAARSGGLGAVVRLESDGDLDTTFDVDGIADINPDGLFTTSRANVIIPSGGGYLVAGSLGGRRAIVRLNSVGALDTANASMGSTGYWRTALSNGSTYMGAIVDEGKLIAVGAWVTSSAPAPIGYGTNTNESFVLSVFPLASDGGSGSTTTTTSSSSSGGGALVPWMLLLVGLLGLRRR